METIDKDILKNPDKLKDLYKLVSDIKCPNCGEKGLLPILLDFSSKVIHVSCLNCRKRTIIKME